MNLPNATSAMIPAKYRALDLSALLIWIAAPFVSALCELGIGFRGERRFGRIVFLLDDPFAHPAQRLEAVMRAGVGHARGIAERNEALRAVEGEAIAQLRLQLIGVYADGLCVGGDRSYGNLQIVDRHEIGDAIRQDAREVDRLTGLRDDDCSLVTAADDTVVVAHHLE